MTSAMRPLYVVLLLAALVGLPPRLSWAEVQEGGIVRIPAHLLGNLEKLIIRHPQGRLVLRGWPQKEVHIHFLKRAPTAAMVDLLRVQVDMHDGQVRIRSGVETRGELRALPQPDAGIDLTIDAPQNAQLFASTFGGDLEASGFRRGVDLGSNTGAIRVSDVSGAVKTHAGQGDQWLRSIQGEVNATGVDGDVALVGVEGPSLIAQVVRGQITARDIRVPVVRMQATLGTLLLLSGLLAGGSYELHVDEGDIRVELPLTPDLHFAIEAEGTLVDNRLRLDPGASSGPTFVRGEFRGGGPALKLTSTRGRVTLRSVPAP